MQIGEPIGVQECSHTNTVEQVTARCGVGDPDACTRTADLGAIELTAIETDRRHRWRSGRDGTVAGGTTAGGARNHGACGSIARVGRTESHALLHHAVIGTAQGRLRRQDDVDKLPDEVQRRACRWAQVIATASGADHKVAVRRQATKGPYHGAIAHVDVIVELRGGKQRRYIVAALIGRVARKRIRLQVLGSIRQGIAGLLQRLGIGRADRDAAGEVQAGGLLTVGQVDEPLVVHRRHGLGVGCAGATRSRAAHNVA